MDSLPKRPNAPPSPPRRGPRHVSPPTVQRPGPSSWEPPQRPRSPPQSWDRERGRPMFRPRSRSRSRSFDYEFDFRRSPPPPHPHSRLPRRAWERSRSRSPPPPPKSTVLCKYFSRPTGCDKGTRCRFRHQRPRSNSFSRSRSFSRSPPPSHRSRTPPLHYRRGESPMLIPRGGLKSPPPSLLQRLGPVAASMRQVSPVRTMTVSRDATEPLEEGEERSPGRKTRKPRGGRGRKRGDRDREKGNWDSFVPAEEDRDEYLSGDDGMGGRRMFEPRRDRSQSRSPRAHTGSVSPKSKSRSSSPLQNPATTPTRSSSREKHTRHPDARLSPRSPSRSRSRSQSRSPIRTQDQSPRSHGRSRSRSGSRSSFSRRSRSRSPPPQFRRERERESWAERDRKNITPAPNPGASSATANAVGPGPAIPTGPRWRAGPNAQAPSAPSVARAAPGVVRGGPPPTGPRGDREPPRGPRNMIASGITTGGAVGIPAGPGAGPATWDRPQSAFQSYLAAVQSKIVEREVKKKEEEEEHAPGDGPAGNTQPESIAMDVDIKEEQNPGPGVEAFHSYTPPVAEPSRESSQVASPAHFNLPQISSLHASPASGQTIPLPPQSGPSLPGTHTPTFSHLGAHVSLPLPQVHPLPLPPRPRSPPRAPRSPPRGPRATRGLPEKPKGMGGGEPSRDGAERDRGRDSAERGRDRNERGERDRVGGGEVERKVHALPTNPARRPRMPTVRTSKREVLFPDLEKEIANLEDQRARLASEHVPYAIAFQQAVHDLTLSTIDYRAAEDRRVMTEAVLEAMGKVSGLTAGSDM